MLKLFFTASVSGCLCSLFISSGASSCENSKKEQNKEEKRTTALIHRLLVLKILLFITNDPIYEVVLFIRMQFQI